MNSHDKRAVTEIQFKRQSLDQPSGASLEKIIGKIKVTISGQKLPFVGYLFTIPKSKYQIKLNYSPEVLTASQLAKKIDALAVINGGFWNKEKHPLDWCVCDDNIITPLHNAQRPCIYWSHDPNPSISIGLADATCPHSSVLQAGPLLLKEGIIQADFTDFQINAQEFDSDITADRHPRTIFGYNNESYFFLVIEGRSMKSAGLYLEECAQLTQQLGFTDAINLDGGASSTLVVGGKRINEPRFCLIRGSRLFTAQIPGKERPIPTFLYVIPK